MNTYEQLREVLDTHPSTAPESDAIMQILGMLFTPDEAGLAAAMSFRPWSVKKIAAAASRDEDETVRLLESMADKGILFSKNKDDGKQYGLVPLIPGVFEFPFMKADGSPRYKKLGELWETYHREALGASFAGNPTPLMRVVPVEKSLPSQSRVHPYEEVKSLINNSAYIALADCACRTSVGKCDRPKDVCLIFEGAAEFLVERGFARHISKEEGISVLDRSEEAGLVHTSNNSADRANVICNCCPCCCTVLRGKTELKHPHAFEPSRFEARITAGDCTGCGLCAEQRCPTGAITMKDDIAAVSAAECIGCGLCVTGCPAGAIGLAERAAVPAVPATIQEMGLKAVQEKGRLDQFIKVMQR